MKKAKSGASRQLQALSKIVKASNIGPRIYVGLPSEGKERVEALSAALKETGMLLVAKHS